MKKASLILFFCLSASCPGLFSQSTINANFQNELLVSVFERLSENYHLKFAYDNQLIQNIRITSIIKDLSIEKALHEILSGTDLIFEITGGVIIIKPREKSKMVFQENSFIIRGIIKDSLTLESLPYATIIDKQTGQFVVSNADGYFSYKIPNTDSVSLHISYLGYQNLNITLRNGQFNSLNKVYLTPVGMQFKEVIVKSGQNKPIQKESGVSHFSIDPIGTISLPQIGENDLFRSMQLLPGISATGENSAGLSIRGSAPEQNLIVFDGFNLYHADHFFGEFSALNPEIIKNVQIYKSGYEARYGGRATGMVLLTSKTGNLNKPSFNVGLNMLSSHIMAEFPIGKKISFIMSARRSYTDILKSNVYKSIFQSIRSNTDETIINLGGVYESINNSSIPDFYYADLNTKLSYFPNDKNIVTFSFYKGLDNFKIANEHIGNIYSSNTINKTNWGNTGASIRWAKQWNAKFYNNISLGISEFLNTYQNNGSYTLISANPYKTTDNETNKIDDITFNVHNEFKVSTNNKIEFGIQSTNHKIDYQQTLDSTQSRTMQSNGNEISVYLQTAFNPSQHLTINPGIRLTYSNIAQKSFIEPRLSATYFVTDEISFKGAVSKHTQVINKSSFDNSNGAYRDFWYNANAGSLPALTSTHYVMGGSFSNTFFDIDIEGYYLDFKGLSEIKQNSEQDILSINKDFFAGNGFSKGIDVFLYKKTGMLNAWACYSYCIANNTFAGLNNGVTFPADNDQRHEFKLSTIFNYKTWAFSAVWIYGSGKPYTGIDYGFSLDIPNGTQRFFMFEPAQNSLRLPDYQRLDVSCTYSLKGYWCAAKIGLSIINLYGHSNMKSLYDHLIKLNDKNQSTYIIERVNTNSLGFTPNCFINFTF